MKAAPPRPGAPPHPCRWAVSRRRYAIPLAVLLGACAGPTPPPATVPAPVPAAELPQELVEEAEGHFRAGEAAFRQERFGEARAHFDAALHVYLEAQVPPGLQDALQRAFNELFTRIHVLGLDELVALPEQPVTLPNEHIPPLKPEEAAAFRARLATPAPSRPRFTVPVPDPLENRKLLAALRYLTEDRREVIEEGLGRAQRYLSMIREVFAEAGLPLELAWVPLVESLFKPHARSRAGAMGLWQFMRGTARLYGLRVDWYVDERRDPVRATRTAARYLKDLHAEFGDWTLALAAYNGGKGRVRRAMARTGSRDFWRLAETRYLARETRDFVPKVMAAILIGHDPARYGLRFEPQEPLRYDEVTIDSMTDLRVIAECAGTTAAVIRTLNPHLLRATTPNVPIYTVRIPAGSRDRFLAAFAAIPPEERVYYVEHRVARGETLSTIAARYDTAVAAIMELNGLRNPHRIRAGSELLIPVGQPGRPYRGPRVTGYEKGERVTYQVRRGDSLYEIANAFRTSVADVMRWNDLRSDLIYPGDELVLYYGIRGGNPRPAASAGAGDGGGAPRRGSALIYTVRRGDTLYEIAERFGVSLGALLAANGLSRRSLIHPGDRLRIPGRGGPVLYVVRRGDTLSGIAARFGVRLADLCAWNGLTPRSVIRPGETLTIRR